MSKPEIYKTLVLSTAHLTEEWGRDLQAGREFKVKGIPTLIYHNTEYGHRVYADLEFVPDFFIPAVKLAIKHGCRWLEYDCDADEVEGLETYEW